TFQPTRQTVAGVYAANTFGAVFGTYLSIFVIAPVVGLKGSLFCLASFNLSCAAVAFVLALRRRDGESESNQAAVEKTTEPRRAQRRATQRDSALFASLRFNSGSVRLAITLFFSGLLGIAVETVG